MRRKWPTANERLDELEQEEKRQHRVLEAWKQRQPKSVRLLEFGILALLIAAILLYILARRP